MTITQEYVLPWPPSVNKAWVPGKRNGKTFMMLTDRQRDYRSQVLVAIRNQFPNPTLNCALRVTIALHPKTHARYDCDNFCKSILDGMTHAKVWEDDSQVMQLNVSKCAKRAIGSAIVLVTPLREEIRNG